MKTFKPIILLVTFVFWWASAVADEAAHYAAAERFYDTTNATDAASLTNQIVSAMMSRSPELVPHKAILVDFMLEIIESEEYRDLKIRSYMAYLSESQLNELSKVFSSEAYQHFRAHQVEILQESNEGIQRLMSANQGELARRIEENAKRLAQ